MAKEKECEVHIVFGLSSICQKCGLNVLKLQKEQIIDTFESSFKTQFETELQYLKRTTEIQLTSWSSKLDRN